MKSIAALASIGLASAMFQCQSNNICLNANFVDNVLYLNATGPSTLGWFGIGVGTGMAGAQLFVFMRNSSGATLVSARTGPSEVMPTVDQLDWTLDHAASSGGFNASLSCPGCAKRVTAASAQPFIWSMYAPAKTFTTASDNLAHHSVRGTWMFDVSNNTLHASGASVQSAPVSKSIGGNYASRRLSLIIAHGVLMATSFVFLFPIGAIFIRFWSLRAHYLMQGFNVSVLVAGFGIAVFISKGFQLSTPHQIIGLVVFICIWLQALLGLLHHLHYKRSQVVGFYHRYFGRAVILLGIANGYLGIELALDLEYMNLVWPVALYWAVAGVMLIVYTGLSIYVNVRSRRRKGSGGENECTGA